MDVRPQQLVPILGAHPLEWSMAFAIPLAILLFFLFRGKLFERVRLRLDCCLALLGLGIFGAYSWYNFVYLLTPDYMGGIDAQVAGVSWYFMRGHEIYHGSGSPEIYGMLYGPYLYAITGLFEKGLGPSSFSAKLPGQMALILSIPILFLILRKRLSWSLAVFAASLLAVSHIILDGNTVAGRPDALILVAVVVGAWAAFSPTSIAPFLFGVAVGVAANLKLHAVVYFVPFLYFALKSGHRLSSALKAVVTAAVITALPFILLPNVSLKNYLWVLKLAASHGFDPNYYLSVTAGFFMLCLPIALYALVAHFQNPALAKAAFEENALLIKLILAEFVILLIPAMKYGAGPHHLMPMAIPLILLWAELYRSGLKIHWPASIPSLVLFSLLVSWIICAFAVGAGRSYQLGAWIKGRAPWARSVDADLEGVLAKYGSDHLILMGSGKLACYLPYFRTKLIFSGMPIGIDPSAMDDYAFAKFVPPPPTVISAALSNAHEGKKMIWLVPKGEAPFTLENWYAKAEGAAYAPPEPVYSDDFRGDFAQHFKRTGASEFYDVYAER